MSQLKVRRIDGRAKDGFDKNSWIEEGMRHLRSAKILRSSRRRRRAAHTKKTRNRLDNILAMDAAVHSSVLLVSYSVELFLKAGLTRVYIGCSDRLFQHEVRRLGHNLVKLAQETEYALTQKSKSHLRDLKSVILGEGRYPFLSANPIEHRDSVNRRAHKFWSDERFNALCRLAEGIREHALQLDSDSDNPATPVSVSIDKDGYFAFRCGGHLSPRITVKYSSAQKAARSNNKRALKRAVLRQLENPLIAHFWDSSIYRCVKK